MEKRNSTIYLSASTVERLDRFAEKISISRNKLMENLIETGLDDIALLEKSGMLFVGTSIRDILKKVETGEINSKQVII